MTVMKDSPISFPGLFGDWQFRVGSVALHIGNGIYWYGIILALGVLAGLALFCAAIFLNGKYAEKVDKPTKVLGQSELVSTDGDAAEVSANAEGKDYFASARLTRQQARDSALSLLKEASENDDVDAETASEAAKSIETLASYTLSEAQIENMVTAKGYEDCVVFMSEDGVSVVVSTGEEGLQTEDIARITDIVKQETGLSAESIKIMEVN